MTKEIADRLIGDSNLTIASLTEKYPNRGIENRPVTRFAPSPTGYLHIGGLYVSIINKYIAQSEEGIFFLRIEDTDTKRKLDDGISEILRSLDTFDIHFDEGPISETEDVGHYGPYRQSDRKEIYQTYVKDLLIRDLAYPCFCTEDEINSIRETQKANGEDNIGYYGKYASCRTLNEEAIAQNLDDGKPYVIRLKSPGNPSLVMKPFEDLVRGTLEMPENFMDIVLLKQDGLPTYHLAHAVDDHLMGVTHVIRADEWIASLPIHVQLFECLGFEVPNYAHVAPIMKMDGEARRKLSKRKDPEARVGYYHEEGYPIEAIYEYLLTIISSSFEDWREAHPDEDIASFKLDLTTMSRSGALFDFMKLNHISKKIIKNLDESTAFGLVKEWAKHHDEALSTVIETKEEWFRTSMAIWREQRMDVAKWSDLHQFYPYLYDEAFDITKTQLPDTFVGKEAMIKKVLEAYLETLDCKDDSSVWFDKVKVIAGDYNYCVKMKLYKKNPDDYNGSIAELCTYIRLALTGLTDSPDLHQIQACLGQDEAVVRIKGFIKQL